MSTAVVRPAAAGEVGTLTAMLERSELPIAGLEDTDLFVLEGGDEPIGLVGIETHGCYALMRSLTVNEGVRGQGYGRILLGFAEEESRRRGLRAVFGLTTTIPELLTSCGFTPVERTDLPAELAASAELRGACPASAQAFRKVLR